MPIITNSAHLSADQTALNLNSSVAKIILGLDRVKFADLQNLRRSRTPKLLRSLLGRYTNSID
jgi:hypothetical protein